MKLDPLKAPIADFDPARGAGSGSARVILNVAALDGWPGLMKPVDHAHLLEQMPHLQDRYISYLGRRISQRSTYPGMPTEVEGDVLASLLGPKFQVSRLEQTWGGCIYGVAERSATAGAKPLFTIESSGDGESFAQVHWKVSDADQAHLLFQAVMARQDAVMAEIQRVRQDPAARSTMAWLKSVVKGAPKSRRLSL